MRTAHWALLASLVPALVVAGCGLRTAPHPVETLLPVPGNVALWQQGPSAVLAWDAPPGAGEFGVVIAFMLRIERRELSCPPCPALELREVELKGAALVAARSGGRYLYPFEIGDVRALWVATVAARFTGGASLPTSAVTLEAPERLPRHELEAAWLPGNQPALRLSWLPRRDRIVQVLIKDGAPAAREVFFRANIYQRDAGGTWPLRPLNGSPIGDGQWLIRFIVPNPPPLEYGLRLVDSAGNEGPLSAPVALPQRGSAQ